MQLTPVPAPATPTSPTPPAAPTNPWGFPALDRDVAARALAGVIAGSETVDRLIDRSIEVRVLLDRDLKARSFGSDTVRAVHLLTRARDYALDTLRERHLSDAVVEPVYAWIRGSRDERLRHVSDEIHAIQSAVTNLLDDEEGNVRETIATMRTAPNRHVWQSIRDGVDGALANLYGARDTYSSRHVLRAAGGIR